MPGRRRPNPETAREIGNRIAQARMEAGGMTQRELAELLRVSERSVLAYETGEVIPYRFMRRLEEVLAKPTGWFLVGDDAVRMQDKQFAEILEELKALRAEVRKLSLALTEQRDA
jgi:transcriptional regulator with XRE-family HTH domain